MDAREKKLLTKCFKQIDWIEDYDPSKNDRKRHALLFICPVDDDEDEPVECIKSRIIVGMWDGEDWLEQVKWDQYEARLRM